MAKTDYAGIDYTCGSKVTNQDTETGIHYGVIHAGEVDWWHEESEPHYPECECKEREDDECFCEPSSWFVKTADLEAEQSCDDSMDIFVFKSKYFTHCQYCSPCAPGAGYLTTYTDPDVGIKAYCFGPDWFDKHIPYPIYSVETGKLVKQATDETLPVREA